MPNIYILVKKNTLLTELNLKFILFLFFKNKLRTQTQTEWIYHPQKKNPSKMDISSANFRKHALSIAHILNYELKPPFSMSKKRKQVSLMAAFSKTPKVDAAARERIQDKQNMRDVKEFFFDLVSEVVKEVEGPSHNKWGNPICPKTCPLNAGKRKTCCVLHGGSALCPVDCPRNAGKHKVRCALHGGSALCPVDCPRNAGKEKSYCVLHGGSALCPVDCPRNAGKYKARCALHGGSALCPVDCPRNAGKQKARCALHGGSALCPFDCPLNAGKLKSYCVLHGGSQLCRTCRLFVISPPVYDCLTCRTGKGRIHAKEIKVVEYLRKKLQGSLFEFVHDKSEGKGECSGKRYRPDIRFTEIFGPDNGYYWRVILEVDENKHDGPSYDCDAKRMNDICIDSGLAHHFIRFNPDGKNASMDALIPIIKECFSRMPVSQFEAHYLFY